MPGIFITLEGVDGAGKTTQISILKQRLERMYGAERVVQVFDPGGTPLGTEIRKLLKSGQDVCLESELLLFQAARCQLAQRVVLPSLAAEKIVLSDRWYDSTVAYQGGARGLPMNLICDINSRLVKAQPDVTVLLDIDPEVGLKRADRDARFDNIELQRKVRESYLSNALVYHRRITCVDASLAVDSVAAAVQAIVDPAVRSRIGAPNQA